LEVSEQTQEEAQAAVADETWGEAKEEIVSLLGGKTPFTADEETRVQTAWVNEPAHVMDLARTTGVSFAAGNIAYPWAWLAKCCEGQKKGANARAKSNPVLELDKATRSASTQMRNVLVNFDRWAEVEDELFGDRGTLRPWASDPLVKAEWKVKWEEQLELEKVALKNREAREAKERLDRKDTASKVEAPEPPPPSPSVFVPTVADESDIPF
jgi:hypothetical protein